MGGICILCPLIVKLSESTRLIDLTIHTQMYTLKWYNVKAFYDFVYIVIWKPAQTIVEGIQTVFVISFAGFVLWKQL